MALLAAVAREGAAFDVAGAFAASGRSANNLTICCPLFRPSSLPLSARTQSALTRAGNAWLPNTYYMADRRPPQYWVLKINASWEMERN